MQTRHFLHLSFALLAVAACSPDSQPTGPGEPTPPADMTATAPQFAFYYGYYS